MKIDFHSHCFDPTLLPSEYQRALVLAHQARTGSQRPIEPVIENMRVNMNDPDGSMLRQGLEECGIEHTFVIGLDWGFAFGNDDPALEPRQQIRWATQLQQNRDDGYFSYAFGIDPRRANARELVEEALETCAVGVKIYPPAGFRADDPVCDAVYESVIAADAFVITHTGRQTYPFNLEYGRVDQYGSVQRRHPDLRLVLAHAGVPFWGHEAIEVAKGHPGTILEVSGWHKILAVDEEKVRRFLLKAWEELGPYKVAFGTDLVSGPGITKRMGLLHRWVKFYEEVAKDAGVDIAAAEQHIFRELTRSASIAKKSVSPATV
jgi:predicted TIM-barrel fold metal-dependent hydrolase